ncbi:MAG: hypothetical protein Q9160_004657 [Pyrenula sp. 1 TL-2023]
MPSSSSSSSSSSYATLIRPPPPPSSHSLIESALQLTPLPSISPNLYTNTRPLWHPPGARGIFGGAAIAQCLSAAQQTIPPQFIIHSMHCYFVLAGDAEIPVVYEVERIRDGKSFCTRTVQARQRGKCIFTTTMSFVREGSAGKKTVEHQQEMPAVEVPPEGMAYRNGEGGGDESNPFESVRAGIVVEEGREQKPEERKVRQWIRARGRISDGDHHEGEGKGDGDGDGDGERDNHHAHLSALAYMSDSYFIGTVARVHGLIRFSSRSYVSSALQNFKKNLPPDEQEKARKYLEDIARKEAEENAAAQQQQQQNSDEEGGKKQIGMMVSLDHTIFFHNPRAFRADRWMLSEMQSPWAGDGRGLVLQRIWQDGVLIATCVQEGLVRLRQKGESKL